LQEDKFLNSGLTSIKHLNTLIDSITTLQTLCLARFYFQGVIQVEKIWRKKGRGQN